MFFCVTLKRRDSCTSARQACVIVSIYSRYLRYLQFFMLFFATEFSNVFFCVVVVVVVGLYEGCIVSCKVVDEVPVLDVVNVTACNEKDWEMLVSEMHKLDLVAVRTLNMQNCLISKEATSYRIQNTLLDQTKIVNEGQKLVIWVNKAMNISVKIGKFRRTLETFEFNLIREIFFRR